MGFLQKIAAIFSVILAVFGLGFLKGKNSKENAENAESANQIKKFNRIKRNNTRLSDAQLNSKLQRWKRVKDIK